MYLQAILVWFNLEYKTFSQDRQYSYHVPKLGFTPGKIHKSRFSFGQLLCSTKVNNIFYEPNIFRPIM